MYYTQDSIKIKFLVSFSSSSIGTSFDELGSAGHDGLVSTKIYIAWLSVTNRHI